jgi:hypothetical protein
MESIQQKKARNFRGNYIDHHIKVIPKRRKRTPTPRRLIRSSYIPRQIRPAPKPRTIRKIPDANNIILENLKEKLASNLSSMQNEVRKVTRISTHKLQPTPRRRTTSKNIHK